jgi:PilZ domain
MPPFETSVRVSSESTTPNPRAFVRSFNVLLKFARLYGLAHTRSAAQFQSTWAELQQCLEVSRETGLLLGASGSQLLLDGEPLESTAAERSFADLLNAAGVASIGFTRHVHRDEFENLVRTFMETGPKAGTLVERLEKYFRPHDKAGIRVNEIRFVAEDAAFSEARLAAQLTAKTLGAEAGQIEEWFRSPEKMIELIAAAEGLRGGGLGTGTGSGTGDTSKISRGAGPTASAQGSDAQSSDSGPRQGCSGTSGVVSGTGGAGDGRGTGAGGTGESAPIFESDVISLLRLISRLGEATHSNNASRLDPQTWQKQLATLPNNVQTLLRQALASMVVKKPGAKVDEVMLLQLAEDLAIRFALERFQRGEVRVNAVRQMLERMGHELETLRKLLKAREEKMAKAGLSIESHADVLDRQFWATVPESGKRAVLNSPEAWCVPPRNIQQYVEELLGRGESEAAGDILLKYAACVRNRDPEARKKAAIGLGQLATLYSKAASQRLQDALAQIGQQMASEKDPELQTLLGAAFVRLSQESSSRRYYRAMQQALDSLADLEEQRPTWVQNLRPRSGIENRLPEFIEEALAAEGLPEGFTGLLTRLPQASAENLATRLARSGRRSEREAIVEIAVALGGPCKRHLTETLKAAAPAKAATVVGLLSRIDASAVTNILPARLREGGRGFHDAVVRQLSVAGAPERGRILSDSLEVFDHAVVPLALDEIGMCGDVEPAPKLIQLVEGELMPQAPPYFRVKAIEALGRLHAPAAIENLRHVVKARKTFGWTFPEEMRIAAAQALVKIDPDWMKEFLPHSGLDPGILSLAPLDPLPDRDVVRYRRYRRVRLPHNVAAVITSPRGKYSSGISVLSLEGGLLSGDIQLAVGTEATLKIPAGIRPISMRAVVRFVRSHQAGFETVGMALEDRARLRRLLVSLSAGGAAINPEPSDSSLFEQR